MNERAAARSTQVVRLKAGERLPEETDEVAVEEPLEIRVEGRSVAVVMRTPGYDRELAAGFALTEGIVHKAGEIFEITSCLTTRRPSDNVINIALTDPARFDLTKLSRHVFSSSSCGICGKATIAAARQQFRPIESAPKVERGVLLKIPARLAAAQETFQ
ncbi:MAG TPA: formate dehydrogenase accessory sulfurtransferase FdhD, partial [Chthoniobacterales bacterium]|nr:formate dehydrogenase accessory sulfurtransferase FdhD [Chthoniobacterales bacterium]